jgi:GalNAc-alpha-(1->4)-GalNAc-alpha-(1->3)-diNAcBac-PP-undecaprenol alpha-1,4-N-acetyl-D-galactosaminyltransferase
MKVTLVIATLSGGGAERVATNMANYWAAHGREVTIITTDFNGQPPCYDLHPEVKHIDLGGLNFGSPDLPAIDLFNDLSESERAVLQAEETRILKLREAISSSRPEVVVSYLDLTNICTLLATRELGLPVIATEHCDPHVNFIGEGWELLRRRLYPQASYVTVLAEEARDYFARTTGIRIRIIPCALARPFFSDPRETVPRKNGKTLLAMGRLSDEKGFDLLLSAFALVTKTHPDWMLEIFGEGPARPYLESCIQRRGLADRVRMPGFTHRPFDAMGDADLFALSSLDEGFGNVLVEAMACGLAVVSFDCPSGPRHIIRHEVDGMLVPERDVDAMAGTLDRLMGDETERKRLAAKAPDVLERFSLEKIMGMWEELILDCTRPGQAA